MSWVELSWGWAWKYAGTIIQNNDRVKLQPYFSGLMVSACEDSNHCLGTSIKQEIMGAEYYEENAIHRMKKEAKWREKKIRGIYDKDSIYTLQLFSMLL